MTYLLSCNQSNVQYVGETNFPLHTRSRHIAELNLDAIMLLDMLKLLAFESLMYFLGLNTRT